MSKETTVKDVYLYEAGQAEGYREGVKACIAALKKYISPHLSVEADITYKKAIAACQRLLEEKDENR